MGPTGTLVIRLMILTGKKGSVEQLQEGSPTYSLMFWQEERMGTYRSIPCLDEIYCDDIDIFEDKGGQERKNKDM